MPGRGGIEDGKAHCSGCAVVPALAVNGGVIRVTTLGSQSVQASPCTMPGAAHHVLLQDLVQHRLMKGEPGPRGKCSEQRQLAADHAHYVREGSVRFALVSATSGQEPFRLSSRQSDTTPPWAPVAIGCARQRCAARYDKAAADLHRAILCQRLQRRFLPPACRTGGGERAATTVVPAIGKSVDSPPWRDRGEAAIVVTAMIVPLIGCWRPCCRHSGKRRRGTAAPRARKASRWRGAGDAR
jgi:hypothetical protein